MRACDNDWFVAVIYGLGVVGWLAVASVVIAGCGDDKCKIGSEVAPGVCHVPNAVAGRSTVVAGAPGRLASSELAGGRGGIEATVASATAGRAGGGGTGDAGGDAGMLRAAPDGGAADAGVGVMRNDSGVGGREADLGDGGGDAGAVALPTVNGGSGGEVAVTMLPVPRCGDGIVDPGEHCDGNCLDDCSDGDSCTVDAVTGSSASCDVVCVHEPASPKDGDGCCLPTSTIATDSDCSASCGDGVVTAPEKCDGKCPTTCDDQDPCTIDKLVGSVEACSVECVHSSARAGSSAKDSCCPAGANANTDADCSPECGNGIVEAGEVCDGKCPRTCDDGNVCTTDKTVGAEAQCTLACAHEVVTSSKSGDGCCPDGADATTDSDCVAVCGNGITEPGEECDASCPAYCTAEGLDICTTRKLIGSGCHARCVPTPKPTGARDGCCPASANCQTDPDCKPTMPGEFCLG